MKAPFYINMKNEYKTSLIVRLISGVMLLLAVGKHPYSYYAILRWIVSGSSLYSGWVLSKLQSHNWAWFFFMVGILFNPIFPVYLDRSTWQVIDIIIAAVFAISLSIKNKIYEKNI